MSTIREPQLTYLSDCDNFPVCTPSCLVEVLRQLSCLPTTGLPDNNGNRISLNQVKQTLPMSCNWKQ